MREAMQAEDKNVVQWWELAQDAAEKISAEQVNRKFEVERVFVLGKIFPRFLQPEDFGKMVNELAYDRDPESFTDHESESLLTRVANDNREIKQAA